MTKALKAALLSGLILPGLGQISLKRYKRGIILMAPVLGALGCIIVVAARTAVAILERLEIQGGDIDMATISRLAVQSGASSSAWYYGSLLVIVCCWVFAIVDAYRIGKANAGQDQG